PSGCRRCRFSWGQGSGVRQSPKRKRGTESRPSLTLRALTDRLSSSSLPAVAVAVAVQDEQFLAAAGGLVRSVGGGAVGPVGVAVRAPAAAVAAGGGLCGRDGRQGLPPGDPLVALGHQGRVRPLEQGADPARGGRPDRIRFVLRLVADEKAFIIP